MDNEIQKLQKEIVELKKMLVESEEKLRILQLEQEPCIYMPELSTREISRYSRQMLIPEIGVSGQLAVKRSKVLVVGVGGLGSPAAMYLVAAGAGEVTVVDYDEVELSNLHRQVLHSEYDIGVNKVDSAFDTLASINSDIKVIPLHMHINGDSLSALLNNHKYDVVLDCTDNVATRYLLNDLCVIYKIPLVSGSALQLEGQLTVYNYKNGPCYRCIFPIPPPPHAVTSCGDGGVLGVVPGVIGVLQALEALKIVMNLSGVLYGQLLLFDGSETSFRTVRLRNRNVNCDVCGEHPKITKPIDYEQFCGAKAHDKVEDINILESSEVISVKELFSNVKDHFLIDVRPHVEYQMCHLPKSINIPYILIKDGKELQSLRSKLKESCGDSLNVYVICRRGNDSQRAVSKLKEIFTKDTATFINVAGGLYQYSKLIDSSFPVY